MEDLIKVCIPVNYGDTSPRADFMSETQVRNPNLRFYILIYLKIKAQCGAFKSVTNESTDLQLSQYEFLYITVPGERGYLNSN